MNISCIADDDIGTGCVCAKAEWKVEIQEQLQKIKSDGGCYPQQLEEELIRRRRQELRSVGRVGQLSYFINHLFTAQ